MALVTLVTLASALLSLALLPTEVSLAACLAEPEAAPPGDTGPPLLASDLTAEELELLRESLASDQQDAPSGAPSSPASSRPAPRGGTFIQSLNPNMSLILDVAASWFSLEEPLQVGAHDPNQTGFTLQQLEMYLEANADPYFRLQANLVFSLFGVELEEAFVTTLSLPLSLQARAGQFLTRMGRLNASHPHSWSFLDQPLVNGKFFGPEGSRGLGLEFSWLSPLPWFAEVVFSTNEAAGAASARSFLGAKSLPIRDLGDLLYTTALRQFFALGPDWSLLWGLSSQFGPNSSGRDNRSEIYGTDVYLRYRPIDNPDRASLSWQSELFLRTRQVPHDSLRDWGFYSQLVWNIDSRRELGLRHEWVSGIEDDDLDPDWSRSRHRSTIQATYYPSHFSRLRLQASRDDPGWLAEPIWALMLGLEVMIGAHGAHDF